MTGRSAKKDAAPADRRYNTGRAVPHSDYYPEDNVPVKPECFTSYQLFVLFFAVFMIPMCLMDLSEQVRLHSNAACVSLPRVFPCVLHFRASCAPRRHVFPCRVCFPASCVSLCRLLPGGMCFPASLLIARRCALHTDVCANLHVHLPLPRHLCHEHHLRGRPGITAVSHRWRHRATRRRTLTKRRRAKRERP